MTASFLSPAWKGFVALVELGVFIKSSFQWRDLSIVTIRLGWLVGTCHIVRETFFMLKLFIPSIVRL